MDIIYYLTSFAALALIISGVGGLVRPKLLARFLGKFATRKHILIGSLILLMVCGSILSATEPESLKQQRITQEQARKAEIEAKSKKDAELRRQEEGENRETIKEITETEAIDFVTESKEDSVIEKGQTVVAQEGQKGEKQIVYLVTYKGEKEVSRKRKGDEKIIKQPVSKIVKVGTYTAPTSTPASTYSAAPSNSSSGYYANCTEAKKAGVTPLYQGQPGYRSALDSDHDGIACET